MLWLVLVVPPNLRIGINACKKKSFCVLSFFYNLLKFLGGNVSKMDFKNMAAAGLIGFSLFSLTTTNLSARIPETSSNAVDECSKELLLSYFPKAFVNETLSKYKVPQDQWDAINKELAEKDKEVIKIVEEKASKISPNLLRDPQQRQAAVKLFRETLFDVFSKVMKAHGVTDDKEIQQMLDDIQRQKALRFKECMEKHRNEAPSDNDKDDEDNNG